MKNRWEESEKRREEKKREEKSREEKKKKKKRESLRRKKIQAREKVGKYRNTVFFPMTCGSGGSKSRLAKAAGAEPADERWKIARRCGAEHISKSKCTNTHHVSDHFRKLWRRKKCTPLWREAHFEVKNVQNHHMFGPLLEVQMSFRVAGARDCAPCQILEHQIFSFGKMILRDRCSTSYDLASLFRGRRNTLDRWSGKIAKRIGTRPPALHSTFHFWRKSRRIASFLMLSTSKNEEVSQNCFVFDIAAFSKLTIRQTVRQADKTERKKER